MTTVVTLLVLDIFVALGDMDPRLQFNNLYTIFTNYKS